MKKNRLWCAVLAFWTLLLALWTALCWNAWAAKAAESRALSVGARASAVSESAEDGRQALILDVPFLDQEEEGFPTGCESVSAVMALQYAGVEISVEEFVEGFLPLGDAPHNNEDGAYVGCDPRRAFPGDPRTEEGWGCYAPVILEALEQLLQEREVPSLSKKDLSGMGLEELCCRYVGRGTPVLLWVTIGMEEPYVSDVFTVEGTGEDFQWLYPLHCMVLVGWDDEFYYCNDPLKGKAVPYPKEETERAYEGMGRQAAALLPEGAD